MNEREEVAQQLHDAMARHCAWPPDVRWDRLVPALRAPYLAMADTAIALAARQMTALRTRGCPHGCSGSCSYSRMLDELSAFARTRQG